MVRYGAQGESTVQYCGTIVVHGTVRGTARRMRSWYICMVRYGTVQIYYSGTWHMVQYVSHIAPMYGSQTYCANELYRLDWLYQCAVPTVPCVPYHVYRTNRTMCTVPTVPCVPYRTVPCFKIGKMVPYQNSSRNSGRICRYFCCYFGTVPFFLS